MKEIIFIHRVTGNTKNIEEINIFFLVPWCLCGEQKVTK